MNCLLFAAICVAHWLRCRNGDRGGFLFFPSSFVNTPIKQVFSSRRLTLNTNKKKSLPISTQAQSLSGHSTSHPFLASLSPPQTEQFVHTLKDELVKSALLALHAARPGYVSKSQKQTPSQGGQRPGHNHQSSGQNQSPAQGLPGHSPTTSINESATVCNNVEGSQTTARGEGGPLKPQDSIPHHKEYDEEEWVSVDSTFNELSLYETQLRRGLQCLNMRNVGAEADF